MSQSKCITDCKAALEHTLLLKSGLEDLYQVKEFFNKHHTTLRLTKPKKTCWEYRKCNYTKCPARLQSAGRRCWLVAGSLSGSKVFCQILTSNFIDSCKKCDFYLKVRKGTI